MEGKMKTMKIFTFIIIIGVAMSINPTFANENNLGEFEASEDIGKVKHPGSVQYDSDRQTFAIQGSGTNMWFDRDEFHYLYKKIHGNFIVRAQMEFIGEGVDPHRKMGWIVRNTFDTDSPHVNASIHGDGLTSLQYRKSIGGETEEVKSDANAPVIVQLERQGNTFIMSTAKYGEPFESVEVENLSLNHEAYVGLYVCSHNPDVSEKAIFNNVRIIIPAPDDFQPYKDYIGSHLEVMDVFTGQRKVLYTDPSSIQAPNWTLDGKSLIYNREGLLYSFDLTTKQPTQINTGFATRNNNDHVLSSDRKSLGISDHTEDSDNESIIYTMPVNGGTPKRVTQNAPSYLHGWSPDSQYLVYTGGRNNQYDIYKIPVTGGDEIQLTNTKGLDDGSEYSPDGNFIYFNSDRTGTMQLWRMKPDGSEPTQITFDEYQDWFPHISPDGKWIVYLSYPEEIASNDHPFYKQVYLRLLPISGGKPKVIAYIYGGQGTINVPSWSPDSTKVAFISNTTIQ
jgi:TolB protein